MVAFLFISILAQHLQLFARRGNFVKPSAEEERWKELSYHFMTEESGRDSTDEITQHKLPWRSESEFQVYSLHYTSPKT